MLEKYKNKQSFQIAIKVLFFIGAFVVLAISLMHIFKLPYTGDDRTNSMTKGIVWYSGQTVRQHTYWVEKAWLDRGRFFPLGFYSRALFYYLPDLMAYRIFQVILNVLVCGTFAALIQKITKRWYIAVFAILMPAVFFQIRDYHDAITGFHGFLQFVTIFFFLAILCQIHASEKKKIFFSVLGGVFYLCSLFLYEVSYSFIAVFIVVAILYQKKAKDRVLSLIPHMIALVITAVPTVYYMQNAIENTYEGVTVSLQIGQVIQTFGIQLLATFPLSYMIVSRDIPQEAMVQLNRLSGFDFLFYLMFAVLLAGCIFMAKKISEPKGDSKKDLSQSDMMHIDTDSTQDSVNLSNKSSKTYRNLFFIGLFIWLVPAGMVSLSIRYQSELIPGIGYLPVYIQYFGGIGIVSTILFYFLEKNKRPVARVLLAVICPILFTFTLLLTQTSHEVARKKIIANDLQSLSQIAIEEGLLDEVDDGARFLMLQGGFAPEIFTEYFVSQYADKLYVDQMTLDMCLEEEIVWDDTGTVATIYPENVYAYYAYGTIESGVALLAKVEAVDFLPDVDGLLFKDQIKQVYFEQARGFAIGVDKMMLSLAVQTEDDMPLKMQIEMAKMIGDDWESETGLVRQDETTGIELQRVSRVSSPTVHMRRFSPYRDNFCIFTAKSNECSILLRSCAAWEILD